MGRFRLQHRKIENKTYRNITFAKRKNGLIKKAYELSTLCDVEVALIVFSPAGKLFIFDGKKRAEEIIKQLIDLPVHLRGRISNEEKIDELIIGMNVQAYVSDRSNSSSDISSTMLNTQLAEIQNNINLYNAELENVEKQLEVFENGSSGIKSFSESKYYERMLEGVMKRLSLQNQILERKISNQFHPPSQTLNSQTTDGGSFTAKSSNNGLGWPQELDHTQFYVTSFANPTGFQPSRNESDHFTELLHSSMKFHGAQYPIGNTVTKGSNQLQCAMTFHGNGYLNGNTVTNGNDQLQSAVTFHGDGSSTRNTVTNGSDQLQSAMPFYGDGHSIENTVINDSDQLQSTMKFHGDGYSTGNKVTNGSDRLQFAMAFHGDGYSTGNTATNGFDQLQYAMAFYGDRYSTRNEITNDSDQLQFAMAFHGDGHSTENTVANGFSQLQSIMAIHGDGYSIGNTVTNGSDQLQSAMAIYDAVDLARYAVNGDHDQLELSVARDAGYMACNEVNDDFDQFFNPEIAPKMSNIQEGMTTTTIAGPSQLIDNIAEDNNDDISSLLYDFPDIPFSI